MEQTLVIIKPDAVEKDQIGNILARLEKSGLKIIGAKMVHLTKSRAEAFYAVHKEKPFYQNLTTFLASGPILVLVLEGENAIAQNRKIMGATDPAKADVGTIRKDFAASIDKNAIHGSDSEESAKKEISFFFTEKEIFSRSCPTSKKSSCCCRCH